MNNIFLILDKLEKLSKESTSEEGHSDADDLLIDTIRCIAMDLPARQKQLIEEIIETYNKVPKWYA